MEVLAHWKQGHKTEAILIGKLSGPGYEVLEPLNPSLRYDLVIEDADGKFWRIPCKTAWINKKTGGLQFKVSSSEQASTRRNNRNGYQGQIDYFAVYAPDTGHCFLVPISDVAGTSEFQMRLGPTKNGQKKGVHDTFDYLL